LTQQRSNVLTKSHYRKQRGAMSASCQVHAVLHGPPAHGAAVADVIRCEAHPAHAQVHVLAMQQPHRARPLPAHTTHSDSSPSSSNASAAGPAAAAAGSPMVAAAAAMKVPRGHVAAAAAAAAGGGRRDKGTSPYCTSCCCRCCRTKPLLLLLLLWPATADAAGCAQPAPICTGTHDAAGSAAKHPASPPLLLLLLLLPPLLLPLLLLAIATGMLTCRAGLLLVGLQRLPG
jgi:hypothetical protein